MAITHQGFDEDQPTMEAVARRVLDWPDNAPLPRPLHTRAARARRSQRIGSGSTWPLVDTRDLGLATPAPVESRQRQNATVLALCIGIDRYAQRPLTGCVADMHAWAELLQSRGAKVQRMLTDEQATKESIVKAWREVAALTRPGDTFVIQYAGHGSQVPDQGRGNPGGGDERFDSAWVPIDGEEGNVLVDDEVGALIDEVPRDVRVVLFTDSCHSGSATRAKVATASPGTRVRFLPLAHDPAFLERYKRRRAAWAQQLTPRGGSARGSLGREIHFAACQDTQMASERDGHGDFTRAAMLVFAELGSTLPTCEAFFLAVGRRFDNRVDQRPNLRAHAIEYSTLLWKQKAAGHAESERQKAPWPQPEGGFSVDLATRLGSIDSRLDALEKLINRLA